VGEKAKAKAPPPPQSLRTFLNLNAAPDPAFTYDPTKPPMKPYVPTRGQLRAQAGLTGLYDLVRGLTVGASDEKDSRAAQIGELIQTGVPLLKGIGLLRGGLKVVKGADAAVDAARTSRGIMSRVKPITDMTREEYETAVMEGTHYFDSLYRSGMPQTEDVFLGRTLRDMDYLGSSGEPMGYHGVQFEAPFVAQSKSDASQRLLGRDIYAGLTAKIGAPASETSRAILEADNILGRAAKAKGHDAIVMPWEVQVLDRRKLPPPETVHYTDDAILDPYGEQLYEGMGYERAKARLKGK